MFVWGKRSLKRLEGVDELLVSVITEALAISRYDMTIPWMGGLRSAEDQNKIFLEGNSTLDGYNKKSYHQSGKAVDVIPLQGGYSNTAHFRHFAGCMFYVWQRRMFEKQIPMGIWLEWGGHWTNFVDMPHWQIVKR